MLLNEVGAVTYLTYSAFYIQCKEREKENKTEKEREREILVEVTH